MTECVRPHPDNAAGPFYVEYGCCTACGVPEAVAPELFAWDGNDHCFVKRQPTTPAETDKALQVVAHAELSCIRYRGCDPEVMTRFAELGEPELCDFGARFDLKPILRNLVVFVLREVATSPAELANQFRDYVVGLPNERYRATKVVSSGESASLEVAWFEDNFHRLVFTRMAGSDALGLVRHYGNLGVSDLLQEWLRAHDHFSEVRWHTEASWAGNGTWRSTPW
jgi:ferredoxin